MPVGVVYQIAAVAVLGASFWLFVNVPSPYAYFILVWGFGQSIAFEAIASVLLDLRSIRLNTRSRDTSEQALIHLMTMHLDGGERRISLCRSTSICIQGLNEIFNAAVLLTDRRLFFASASGESPITVEIHNDGIENFTTQGDSLRLDYQGTGYLLKINSMMAPIVNVLTTLNVAGSADGQGTTLAANPVNP